MAGVGRSCTPSFVAITVREAHTREHPRRLPLLYAIERRRGSVSGNATFCPRQDQLDALHGCQMPARPASLGPATRDACKRVWRVRSYSAHAWPCDQQPQHILHNLEDTERAAV